MPRKHKRREEKLLVRVFETENYSYAVWPGDLNKDNGLALRNGENEKWGRSDRVTWEIHNYSSHDINVKIVDVTCRDGMEDPFRKPDFDENVDGRDGEDPPSVDDLTLEFKKEAKGQYDYKIQVTEWDTEATYTTDDGKKILNGPDIEIY